MGLTDMFKSDEEISSEEYGKGAEAASEAGAMDDFEHNTNPFQSDAYEAGWEDQKNGDVDYSKDEESSTDAESNEED